MLDYSPEQPSPELPEYEHKRNNNNNKQFQRSYDGDKFEYYVWKVNITLENKIIKRELDKVGNYGWELVNSIPEGHNSSNYIFVFKRKR